MFYPRIFTNLHEWGPAPEPAFGEHDAGQEWDWKLSRRRLSACLACVGGAGKRVSLCRPHLPDLDPAERGLRLNGLVPSDCSCH